MKTILITIALVFSNMALASNDLVTVEGVIHSASSGEMDPIYLGDACLIEVELENKTLVGLVTDYEQCDEYMEDLTEGRGLTVVVEKKDRVKNRKVLSVLKRLSRATVFYNTEFGAIENGLADQK